MRHRRRHGHDLARASARSTGKLLAVLLVALCALIVGTHEAYADVDWHEKGANMSATVGPWSYPEGREYALAEFLGYDWSSLSTQVRNSILTDSNGDNQFTQLLNHNVINVQYETQDGVFDWPIINVWSNLFGMDKLWDISTTNERYVAAQEVMKKYMFPNEGESGDNEIPSTGTVWITPSEGSVSSSETLVFCGSSGKTVDEYTVSLSESIISAANASNYLTQYPYYVVQSSTPPSYVGYGDTGYIYRVPSGVKMKFVNGVYKGMFREDGSNFTYAFVRYNYTKTSSGYNATSVDRNMTSSNTYISSDRYAISPSGNVSEPYEPTPDPSPTTPTIQIGDVTIDLSNGPVTYNDVTYSVVYAPDNSWSVSVETHTDNQYGGNVTASDPTDYTSILNAILAAINAFRQEVNGFNNEINANITTAINSLNGSIKNVETTIKGNIGALQTQIHQDIGTLQSNIQDTIKKRIDAFAEDLWANLGALDSDILDEMVACAQYIVDGIHFDSDFNDDEIVKWLKLIYSRQKGKKVTVPSPDEDIDGWFEALKKLLDELLGVILSGLNVASLATAFEGLKTHFPISIPWDIAAIVGMFAGGAVTPVFDLPLPNGTNGSYTTIHVDLQEWDDEMALVRQGELILFGLALMYNTKWLFDTMTMAFKRGE